METLNIFIIALLSIGLSIMSIRLDTDRAEEYMFEYTPKDLLNYFIIRVLLIFVLMCVFSKAFIL